MMMVMGMVGDGDGDDGCDYEDDNGDVGDDNDGYDDGDGRAGGGLRFQKWLHQSKCSLDESHRNTLIEIIKVAFL